MNSVIQLLASLVLTILGFILPILTILLSLFPNGIRALSEKYQNEKRQAEANILNEVKKKETDKDLDSKLLQKTLSALEKRKDRAEVRLTYLKPAAVAFKIAVPFLVSFIGLLSSLLLSGIFLYLSLISSLIAFVAGMYAVWISLSVLIEVSEILNESRRNTENKIVELLSKLVEKGGGETTFLNTETVKFILNKKILKEGEIFEFSVDKKYDIPASISNSAEMMARNVEVGLKLTKDFLIEKTSNLNLYTSETEQIIRFNVDQIQAHENNLQGNLTMTFLKAGIYKIQVFIKGENVKYQSFHISFKVIA